MPEYPAAGNATGGDPKAPAMGWDARYGKRYVNPTNPLPLVQDPPCGWGRQVETGLWGLWGRANEGCPLTVDGPVRERALAARVREIIDVDCGSCGLSHKGKTGAFSPESADAIDGYLGFTMVLIGGQKTSQYQGPNPQVPTGPFSAGRYFTPSSESLSSLPRAPETPAPSSPGQVPSSAAAQAQAVDPLPVDTSGARLDYLPAYPMPIPLVCGRALVPHRVQPQFHRIYTANPVSPLRRHLLRPTITRPGLATTDLGVACRISLAPH
ncbi:hypothetical protein FZEAL_8062 [Fusarium zealandicum]|uniref:Uncharacterized protein n=1 Tax=Fusarium zealandicum TaxID=1053134 RepID=A0A8H4UEK2_9HYPO|nr:hypothetical protein FZEAL_8062 [Fusarium zealandicum]